MNKCRDGIWYLLNSVKCNKYGWNWAGEVIFARGPYLKISLIWYRGIAPIKELCKKPHAQ